MSVWRRAFTPAIVFPLSGLRWSFRFYGIDGKPIKKDARNG